MNSFSSYLCASSAALVTLTAPAFAEQGLDKAEAAKLTASLIKERQQASLAKWENEWDAKALKHGDYTMKFTYNTVGNKPSDGRALYIAMHGGGGAPPRVNDQQWENHKNLYTPVEGIYFVPRAPTDTWNMWHQGYMDPFIEKIIELAVIKEGVNPNKVYIMGYSAGGDGTYQLAPRLADLWGAAAMSAGHPGDAQIENLYNLPFGLYMGAKDAPYKRNLIAAEWKEKLAALAKANKGAYINDVQIFQNRGHWMNLDDAVTMKWMPKFKRNPIPQKIVWLQDDVLRERFYWLQVPLSAAKQNDKIVISYKGNTINIEETNVADFTICLNDAMLNLDKPVTVELNGKQIYNGPVPRTKANIESDVNALRDRDLIFPAKLRVQGDKVTAVQG